MPTDNKKNNTSFWSKVDALKEKYNALQWVFITLSFLIGVGFNSATEVIQWIELTFDNRRDIVILLEKSEELSAFFESMKNVQADLQVNKDGDQKLDSKVNNMEIELKAELRRLEDGQLQLFLKTERLDERTSGKK